MSYTCGSCALGISVVGFTLLTCVLKTPGLSRAWMLVAFGIVVVSVSFGRLAVRNLLRHERMAGRMHR